MPCTLLPSSQHPLLSKTVIPVPGHNNMIDHRDGNRFGGGFDFLGHGQVGRRGLAAATGVVVGQDDAGGLVAQGRFDDQSRVDRGFVDGAFVEQGGLVDLVLAVQADHIKGLVEAAGKQRHGVLAGGGGAAQDRLLLKLALLITARQGGYQRQQHRGVFGDPGGVAEVFGVGIKDSRQRPVMADQGVGQLVSILHWQAIKKQQFKNLVILKTVDALVDDPLFNPLAMAFVGIFIHGPALSRR